MICDRIAASKIYLKDKYTTAAPLEYFLNKTDRESMHPETCRDLEFFLTILKNDGEKVMLKELKKYVKKHRC